MIKNYFKTAWRNLTKNKTFSLINIAGLSIGMAACLLILQYVSFELSYDLFNKNAPDIYRVVNDRYQNGKMIQHSTITYSAISKAMKDDYPEVQNTTRVEPLPQAIIIYGNKIIDEQNVFAVDNSFLSMFSYGLVTGDTQTALKEPNSVVLSETLARKLFNIKNNNYETLIGKTVALKLDPGPYKITGIFKDVPENSHLQFDFLTSYSTLYRGINAWGEGTDYSFTQPNYWHYIQLKHGADYIALETKLPAFSQRHFQGNKISGSDEKFYLQPLPRAHLYSDFEFEIGKTGSATVVWGLLIIAMLIIVIAWVNYINLATAKSMERAKEVGVRKVAGATKQQLIKQFLTESLIINLIALIIALLIVMLAQSSFNSLIKHQLSLSDLFQKGLSVYYITIALMLLIVAGIFISGFYPAFVLSSLKPVLVLKGKYITSAKGIILRKVLVIGQFAVTVALIIGSFVVYKQMQFVNSQNLGYNISQILIIKQPSLAAWDSTYLGKASDFMNEIKQILHVKNAAASWRIAGEELPRESKVQRTDAPADTRLSMRNIGVSKDFIGTYSIQLLAGRNFTETDYNSNWQKLINVILNQAAVKLLGYSNSEDAIGKTISIQNRIWNIIGVVADFHQKSLRYPLEPTILNPSFGTFCPFSVKVDAKDLSATISAIKRKYDDFFPGNLFDYYFLDEKFNEQYGNDKLLGKVFAIFAGFAIFIACLGLLGLSFLATIQRTKEIGVRKVLGASIRNIVVLLSKDFIRLVIVAFVIASPVAWYVMHNWLQEFAYRINISWWIFFAAGLLAVLIALATISFQAIKAAIANPVKSLRIE